VGWGSDLIKQAGRPVAVFPAYLERTYVPALVPSGTATDWALDSRTAGMRAMVANGAALGEKYLAVNLPVVERQMALGGLRLAKILNEAFR
jgi:hypothetical protein